MEGKINKRGILWGSSNTYSLGNPWVLGPVSSSKERIKVGMPGKENIHR